MKNILTACFLILTLGSSTAARQGDLGVGIILGDPTGLTGKMWLSSRQAIDAALSYDFRHNNYIYLHGDFLMHTDITFLPPDLQPFSGYSYVFIKRNLPD